MFLLKIKALVFPQPEEAAAKAVIAFVALIVSIFLDLTDRFYEIHKAKAAA